MPANIGNASPVANRRLPHVPRSRSSSPVATLDRAPAGSEPSGAPTASSASTRVTRVALLAGIAGSTLGALLLGTWGTWGPFLASGLRALAGGTLTAGGALGGLVGTPHGAFLVAGLAIVALIVVALEGRRLRAEAKALSQRVETLGQTNAGQLEASEVADAVLAVTQEVAGESDPATVPARIARCTCETMGATAAAVLLFDPEATTLRIAAAVGPGSGTEARELVVDAGLESPFRSVLTEGSGDIPLAAVNDSVIQALMGRWRVKALHGVRLERGNRVFGVLVVARRGAASFPNKARRILRGIALQAAAALDNATLVNDLRTANSLKEEFMATMSHELRTPLNVIIGYTDLQIEGAFGDLSTEHIDTLNRIRDHSVQLLDLVQETLDVGRLERGLVTVNLQEVAAADVLERLFQGIPPSWRKPNVELRARVAADLPTLRSDPEKLRVVLRNLVHNALKFTKAGQVLVAATSDADGRCVQFIVQDTGVGIPAQDLERIFEMFRQASDRDPSVGGAGLGLYIVKRLVELLGGNIQVQSAPGRGATFCVSFPIGGPHAAPERRPAR